MSKYILYVKKKGEEDQEPEPYNTNEFDYTLDHLSIGIENVETGATMYRVYERTELYTVNIEFYNE